MQQGKYDHPEPDGKYGEAVIHRLVIAYINKFYPAVSEAYYNCFSDMYIPNADPHTIWALQSFAKASGFLPGMPDIYVNHPSRGYHGLRIECKVKGSGVFLKTRDALKKSPHVSEQAHRIAAQLKEGYLSLFTEGLNENFRLIDWYLGYSEKEPIFKSIKYTYNHYVPHEGEIIKACW